MTLGRQLVAFLIVLGVASTLVAHAAVTPVVLKQWQQAGGIRTNLSVGSRGSEVQQLQAVFGISQTSVFDTATKNALQRFQKTKGLPVTTSLDDKTRAAVNATFFAQLCPVPTKSFPDLSGAEFTPKKGLPHDYAPANLVDITNRVKTAGVVCVTSATADALEKLFRAAEVDGVHLGVTSGFRSPEMQQLLYTYWVGLVGDVARAEVAPAYYSEHQLGVAVDLSGETHSYVGADHQFATTPEGKWLATHAAQYGFFLSYPLGSQLQTGYVYEPWHYRFRGTGASSVSIKPKTGITGLTLPADAFFALYVSPTSSSTQVLVSKNQDKRLPIASVTKLMTAVVSQRTFGAKDPVIVSAEALQGKGTSLKFSPGDTFAVSDLLSSLLIESNNDAARALALKAGEKFFVTAMNHEAYVRGLKNTWYANPTGLDPVDPNASTNYSSAADLALFAQQIETDNPALLALTATSSVVLRSETGAVHHTVISTDELLKTPGIGPRIIGGKTGDTPRANKNLVLVLRPKGTQGGYIVAVVLHTDNHFSDMQKLINWVDTSYEW